jgi:SAM-dependent methyltransferase
LLCSRGASVVGVDLSSDAIATARRLTPTGRFYCEDLVSLDRTLPLQTFDLAISVTTLQHLLPEDQEEAFKQIRRMLKPDGFLILLENVKDYGQHVFARSPRGWVEACFPKSFRPTSLVRKRLSRSAVTK